MADIIYRFAQAEETAQVKELWAYSFEHYEPYFSWYFSTIYRPGLTLGAWQEGHLLAALQIAPYRLQLRKAAVNACYIVGVSVHPAFRRQGLGGRLLAEAIAYLKLNGYDAALLLPLPGVAPFYRRHSFGYAYLEHRWQLPLADLAPWRHGSGGTWQELTRPEQAIPLLDQIYRQMTASLNGYVLRDHKQWRDNILGEHASEQGHSYLLFQEEKPSAYLLYTLKDRLFAVRELGFINGKARDEALAFAFRHQSEADNFFWRAPANDLAYTHLNKPQGISARPFAMATLLNIPQLLAKIPFSENLDGDMRLCLNKMPDLQLNLRKGQAQAITDPIAENLPELHLSLENFSILVFGQAGCEQLVKEGQLQADPKALALAKAMFPPQANWLGETS
ncbi:MAG: GNAT family N-acetyltransferase [Clostridiales bacterium]|nr:GNAT family N-acetyltransferase [Clostridiales bacterium]